MYHSDLHVFTGGTGFVGSAIILELMRTTSARVVAVVRPGEVGAATRLRDTLRRAARLYGLDGTLDSAIHERCHAIAGDIHEPNCGVEPEPGWCGAEFWHCAASLQFQDRHKDAISRTNVEGTRHALAFAQAMGARVFNLISTAYVAGLRTGPIDETWLDPESDASTNNHYERSKRMAESLAHAASRGADEMLVRIMRPSIVIGHSRTRAALNFNGLYGFLRGLVKFRGAMERAQEQLMDQLQVRMRASLDATLNFIPVDLVARDAVALSSRDAEAGVYHLTNAEPPVARQVLHVVFEAAGLRPPLFVDEREAFTWLDRKFNERVEFYNAYFVGAKLFSRAHTESYVGKASSGRFPLSSDELGLFCAWYVEQLEAKREHLPVTQ